MQVNKAIDTDKVVCIIIDGNIVDHELLSSSDVAWKPRKKARNLKNSCREKIIYTLHILYTCVVYIATFVGNQLWLFRSKSPDVPIVPDYKILRFTTAVFMSFSVNNC